MTANPQRLPVPRRVRRAAYRALDKVLPYALAVTSASIAMLFALAANASAPSDITGKWCSAYGSGWKKGDGPLEWARCTRSNLRALLEAEGYAYTLEITDKKVTVNGRRCELIETSKWDIKGYALSLKCPGGKETWRVSLSGKKSDPTLTTPGEVLFDGALSGLGRVPTLPKGNPLIGSWCQVNSKWKTDNLTSYIRGNCKPDGSINDGLIIEEGSYEGHEVACEFSDVKRLPSGDGYLVDTECAGTATFWNEKVEFRLVGKTMTHRVLSHTESVPEKDEDCTAVVSNLPVEKDGSSFLNLRSGPGTEFNVKLKLDPGEKLKVDAEYQGWKRVTATLHDMDISGWVRDKHVTETCKNPTIHQSDHQRVFLVGDCALPGSGEPKAGYAMTPILLEKLGCGGNIDEHKVYFRNMAAQGGEVEVRGPCWSACTLVLSYIPKDKLCFTDKSYLVFHKARQRYRSTADGPELYWPALQATMEMYESYPENIRAWIDGQGGYKRMPMDDGWYLWARNLWEMGYRKCAS